MNVYSIQNVLVPVDLSDTSLNAIETAVALAKKHNATLHLLWVAESMPAPHDLFTVSPVNTDVLSAIASAIRHQHELVPNIIELDGNVTECIVKLSLQLPADLVVIGTHGASGYRDGFIGTNTYNAIKFCNCPVLTVPPGRKITSFRKLLFPIRPISGVLAAYSGVDKFFSAKTTLDVLGFSYKGEGETGLLNKLVSEAILLANWTGITTNTSWGSLSQIPETILHHTQTAKIDLLILTSILDPVAKPTYIGPHAQKIIHSAKVPILSIKNASVPSVAYFAQ